LEKADGGERKAKRDPEQAQNRVTKRKTGISKARVVVQGKSEGSIIGPFY
jgi:hypothetical protein